MIIKQFTEPPPTNDPRRAAGHKAEAQMAFYLHRVFADDQDLCVLNNLRIVDEAATEHNGLPKTCQIDHLIVHRWGMFIIESKSVSAHVTIRDDGSGGDQWTYRYNGRDHGMPSPIGQARRQADALRAFLHRHREQLLGKMSFGLRTFAKLAIGTDQRGFKHMPIQVIVAISDHGNIKRIGKWREPEGPFGTFVCKADLAPDKVRTEFNKHKSSAPVHTKDIGDYGRWSMQHEEALGVARFLAEQHTPAARTPKPSPPPQPPTAATPPRPQSLQTASPQTQPPSAGPGSGPAAPPICKSCSSANLSARSGRYGYYWLCLDCNANTAMPKQCTRCGTSGTTEQPNRISKVGPAYFHHCSNCQTQAPLWYETTPL